MSVIEAALWGLLQGLTEFLPVSSSGHLVLVPWLLGLQAPGLAFDVFVHLATLAAVLIYFRRELVQLIIGGVHLVLKRRTDTAESHLAWLVIISSIPAVLVGALLESTLERVFGSPAAVAVALLVTGTCLFFASRITSEGEIPSLTWRDAALIGLAQAVALIPGISRSGSTISAGLWRGLSREQAARYAFVMSIPVVLGAGAKEVYDVLSAGGAAASAAEIGAGMLVAFVSGYLALTFLFRQLQRHGLGIYARYCWALGGLGLAVALMRALA